MGIDKKRTAHTITPKPFMGSEVLAKKPSFPSEPKKEEPMIIATQKKGSARVAHVPTVVCIMNVHKVNEVPCNS